MIIKGTGKRYLIHTIVMKLNHLFMDENNEQGWLVVVLAPTGLAAYSINGQTIHRFFKLPICNHDYDTYWPLSDTNLKIIRQCIPKLKLVVIGKCLAIKSQI